MWLKNDTISMFCQTGKDSPGLEEIINSNQIKVDIFPHLLKVMESNEPIIIQDVKKDPNWMEISQKMAWVRAYICAPIS